jgi:hypothetical protein
MQNGLASAKPCKVWGGGGAGRLLLKVNVLTSVLAPLVLPEWLTNDFYLIHMAQSGVEKQYALSSDKSPLNRIPMRRRCFPRFR